MRRENLVKRVHSEQVIILYRFTRPCCSHSRANTSKCPPVIKITATTVSPITKFHPCCRGGPHTHQGLVTWAKRRRWPCQVFRANFYTTILYNQLMWSQPEENINNFSQPHSLGTMPKGLQVRILHHICNMEDDSASSWSRSMLLIPRLASS